MCRNIPNDSVWHDKFCAVSFCAYVNLIFREKDIVHCDAKSLCTVRYFLQGFLLVYQVLVDVFSTTYSSFRFLFWWTFFGRRLVSHFFGGRFLVDIWLFIFFGGHNFLTD